MTSVLLVDDHKLVRAGLAALLAATEDIDVVGEASDGRQAVELAARLHPDVVLMDLSMPVLDGVAATRAIVAEAAGAVGYLLKDCDPLDVVTAVRSAADGNAPIDPRAARALLPAPAGRR